MPAPVALFVYARPEHTRKTVEALQMNELAAETDLMVFSDAARTDDKEGAVAVDAVREYVAGITGFNSLTVHHRSENYGLAKSIISGVTEVVEQFGRVIVLEDDIVTSPGFLRFMNDALERYQDESKVWHISGWNYPISPAGLPEAFFYRVMHCWGWATWAEKWSGFDKNPERLMREWDSGMISRFNLDGAADSWGQVTANASGQLNTWAVFWYAAIFEQDGLCLQPTVSFVRNIGFDGSGENCGRGDRYQSNHDAVHVSGLPDVFEESVLALERIQQFNKSLKPSIFRRCIQLPRRVTGRLFRILKRSFSG